MGAAGGALLGALEGLSTDDNTDSWYQGKLKAQCPGTEI